MKQCITACLLFLIISCTKSPEIEIKQPTIEGDYLCMDTFFSEMYYSNDTSFYSIINSYNKQRTLSVLNGGNNKYFVDQDVYIFNRPFGVTHSTKSAGGQTGDSLYIDGKVFFHVKIGSSGNGIGTQTIKGKKIE